MTKRKIALFGGTFDPIHLGHTKVAEDARRYTGAEKVIFIPAKRSVLKESCPHASDADRLKMVSLATEDNENFETSDYELKKSSPSYTINTVRHFQEDYGSETIIYWLIGVDSIDEFSHWYKITELIEECEMSVMYRAGYKTPDFSKFNGLWGAERVSKLQRSVIPTRLIDISSTEIRKRLAAGEDVSDMLHPSVAEYIRKHSIYQTRIKPRRRTGDG